MDNSADLSTQGWATPKPAAGALLAGGVALLLCAVFVAADAAGRTIMAIAALMLLAFGAYAWTIRPRLRLGPGAVLVIRTLRGPTELTPAQVERARVLTLRRIGRRSGQLEIDFVTEPTAEASRDDSRIAVFSRWDLGADPAEVLEELRRAGFHTE